VAAVGEFSVKATRQQKSQRLPPGVAGNRGNYEKKLLAKPGKRRRTFLFGKNPCNALPAFMKTIIVKLVRQYQKRVPRRVREACRFEPSCSCYLILAVEKYGALRGLGRGMGRLFRCHQPNGGNDYP
jgi:putative membrane protein insertion efficiency factor